MTRTTKLPPGVSQLPDGRYKLCVTATCPRSGRRIYQRKTLDHGTALVEAVTERDALKAALLAPPEEEARPRLTLRAYSVRWISAKGAELGENTLKKHISVLAHHILPELGDLYCDAIVREDVQRWCANIKAKRTEGGELYSRDSLLTWWGTCVELLRDMTADLRLERDPTERVKPPLVRRAPKRTRETLSREELQKFLGLARERAAARYAEIVTLAYTGMRVGELYGLMWEDVDHDAEQLHIRRSWSRGVLTEGGKTGVGRAAYMHPLVAEAIQQHRQRLVRAEHPGLQEPWVFTTGVGTPRQSGSLRKCFATLSTIAELDVLVSPQVLRRTFNTLLQAAQVDTLVLWSQMGHSSEAMTAYYTHVSHTRKKEAVLRVFEGA